MIPLYRSIERLTESITHTYYCADRDKPKRSVLYEEHFDIRKELGNLRPVAPDEMVEFSDSDGRMRIREVTHTMAEKPVYQYESETGDDIKSDNTANGVLFIAENGREVFSHNSFEAGLSFELDPDELITGLGQGEDGIFDLRGTTQYLYQANMRISLPFLVTSGNTGILLDTESACVIGIRDGRINITIDTTDNISYYIITGTDLDDVIRQYRKITGRASMLPRWTFGYIQSRETYNDAEELTGIVETFREKQIPLDGIVQDWKTWVPGAWGNKQVDTDRYPDLPTTIEKIHHRNVRLMVSVWPNMSPQSADCREFQKADLMLPNSVTYDAFSEKGRALYWQQCEREWFSSGVDAFWCDSTEPFSDPDWKGALLKPEAMRYSDIVDESRKHMDWSRVNAYALYHARGIHDNWKSLKPGKRVVNLTRSAYLSSQKYGTILWSGDTSAKWSVLKAQISEGLRMSLSGHPYWTLDIGGFFTVRDKWNNRGCGMSGNDEPLWFWNGDYNDGVNDLGYRELYVRWLQYAVFLPIFRSHGTDTPREPWMFGSDGEIFYETILKYIRLRYKLMPYIYSVAAEVHFHHGTMLRHLLMDFPLDGNCRTISDCYMFGPAFLVCPVTRPMYYESESRSIEGDGRLRSIYLPEGAGWYDFWTDEFHHGGTRVEREAPLNLMPLYVRAGSIIPTSAPIQSADENDGAVDEVLIFDGADGRLVLYNDSGDGYAFEQFDYCKIEIRFNNQTKTLLFGAASGSRETQKEFRITLVSQGRERRPFTLIYDGLQQEIKLEF